MSRVKYNPVQIKDPLTKHTVNIIFLQQAPDLTEMLIKIYLILMTKRLLQLSTIFPLIAIAALCHAKELVKVTLAPQWIPQAQFAGYYIAKEKGYFAEAGLDVNILKGGPNLSSSQYVAEKKAEFATLFLSKGISMRSEGIPIVNIGQIIQLSSLMLISKKSAGVHSVKNMDGQKVGLWGNEFSIQPLALFKEYEVNIRKIQQGPSISLFLHGGVNVASAMWYNEYHLVLNSGINKDELNTFFFFDYNLNFPEDGIYVREDFYKKNPELSCNFVQAAIKGWQYAFEHPEETVELLLETENIGRESNKAHQQWMLARMKDIIVRPGSEDSIGHLQKSDFSRVASTLLRSGAITSIPDYDVFFKGCTSHD